MRIALVALLVLAAPAAEARRSVGLGVGAGLNVPTAEVPFALSGAWGFYTDIPLISTFHITPATLVYSLGPKGQPGESATDVSLSFKFIVPLGKLDVFAGITAGVTSTAKLRPHVGAVLGGSINVVSNLDAFVNVNYRFVTASDGDFEVHDMQIFAGPLFRFDL